MSNKEYIKMHALIHLTIPTLSVIRLFDLADKRFFLQIRRQLGKHFFMDEQTGFSEISLYDMFMFVYCFKLSTMKGKSFLQNYVPK